MDTQTTSQKEASAMITAVAVIGSTVLEIDPENGYITSASDWEQVHDLSYAPDSGVICRVCHDGSSDYSLEYYYRPSVSEPSPGWGSSYGGPGPSYWTPTGPVWMFRKGQRVRFYDADGRQVGPEQRNVAPAAAYAMSEQWVSAVVPMAWK